MISCRRTTELLSEGMEQPLPLWKRSLLTIHLAYCRGCRRFRATIFALRGACRSDAPVAEEVLSKETRERIVAMIERRGEPEQ